MISPVNQGGAQLGTKYFKIFVIAGEDEIWAHILRINMTQNCVIDLRAFHYKIPAVIDFSTHHARKHLRTFCGIAQKWDRFIKRPKIAIFQVRL